MTEDRKKVLIFITSYNAEQHIEAILNSIPITFWNNAQYQTEVMIIDNASQDNTVNISNCYQLATGRAIKVLSNPINQGYGGNQKIGYTYAIEQDFDIVVFLDSSSPYTLDLLDELIVPIAQGDADVVLGVGERTNIGRTAQRNTFAHNVLTNIANRLLKSNLTELHSGYRIYSVEVLKVLPFQYNSNNLAFDTDILIQLSQNNFRIIELPCSSPYKDGLRRSFSMKYGWKYLSATLLAWIQRFNIYYHPKFDYNLHGSPYVSKTHFDSTHTLAIDRVKPGAVVIDIGCATGYVAKELKEKKKCRVYGYDQFFSDEAVKHCEEVFHVNCDDFELELPKNETKIDTVLMLDVVEHLTDPNAFLTMLREKLSAHRPEIVITTGNIGFIMIRLSLLLGQFNYGKRGILDLTHKRLFTFSSLKQLLKHYGYEIIKVEGVPVPIPFIFGDNAFSNFLLKINRLFISLSKGAFSFQIAIIAKPLPTLNLLLNEAKERGEQEYEKALALPNNFMIRK